jgi:hypothetical protein
MSKTDEYRQFANDCIVWARIATSDDRASNFSNSRKSGYAMRRASIRAQSCRPRKLPKHQKWRVRK